MTATLAVVVGSPHPHISNFDAAYLPQAASTSSRNVVPGQFPSHGMVWLVGDLVLGGEAQVDSIKSAPREVIFPVQFRRSIFPDVAEIPMRQKKYENGVTPDPEAICKFARLLLL